MAKLDNQVCLVTGGARGIGRAITILFAREGGSVAIVDLDRRGAEALAGDLTQAGHKAIGVQADVSKSDQVDRAFKSVEDCLGDVQILVNNAGIDTFSPVVDMSIDMWERMISVDLTSVFLCTKAVLPAMLAKGRGRVINISSQLAYKGAPTMAHYAAAKAGVLGFTRSLAYEVAPRGVLVNAIAPGPIATELWSRIPEEWKARKLSELPLGRPGTPEEIAPTALLLASDEGAYYVGATLSPNGGDVMV